VSLLIAACVALWVFFLGFVPFFVPTAPLHLRISSACAITFAMLVALWWMCIFKGTSALADSMVAQFRQITRTSRCERFDELIDKYRHLMLQINKTLDNAGNTTHLATLCPIIMGKYKYRQLS